MKTSYSTLAIAALTLCTATAGYADLERGKRLFNQSCAMCHGKQGEKSALDQSALLNTLKTDEIITALQARKAGEIVGAGNAAKNRLSEEDMKSLAEYIETLK
ncbi:c-type cytochrome [Caviibacterium pharyngocola]|uniref:Cytochrome C biogenesis protein CcsB n=1 Tax=Caviibacterium pharyngocola TaxID=28159 RepID=A0A2M8RUU4_9PAST|nr:c-type cytochrome [Caviibacterium pharyngocola]PJG82651.1 cytochrome C biogenesis protein CcsB [Caviibacterium pharyngocola]